MHFGHVLITGGAGFVGSQLLKRLEPISDHIYVIDDLSSGRHEAVVDSKKVTFYQESYTNEDFLEEVLPRVEWVFHLACSSLTHSVLDMRKDFHTNLFGAFLLLEKTKALCPSLKRMVYTSTASVYGNASVRPTPESFYHISTPYSASKFSAEHYFQVYSHMYNMPITMLRLSNVFGPGQLITNPYCGVVAKFFDAVEKKEPISIYGDGTQSRDFSYIEDVIDAILIAASHKDSIGKLYNIGSGIETSVQQLAAHISTVAGFIDYPTVSLPKRVIDNVHHRSVNNSLIKKELQWAPRHTLRQGLEETYNWLKKKG
ncbi:UDP-glucose 4-epimerase [Paenibacillus baekrokdamisoli]|uniref:UDP-glucose 4-epimerase n=2 Tax=Paenibacillus baekrokdamisoli TaxID=1712516 RepID=A0A3G9J361_9BACL|nr:NAD-dependent epimerase/dehydratase family protein [Paenibacillus baekrokdamisoli]MBB3069414.1 UDP-glucose 4-epimerase [Paenibacillus baekrokdamisoli]BBH25012.1 UDP-glucose 4-epimerase [Paenibacillus baekrokdamisoli]